MSGGQNNGSADAFAVAFIGGAFADANFNLHSNVTAIFDGDNAGTGVITGINGVDIRAIHRDEKYHFDASGICICIGPSHSSDDNSGTQTLTDIAAGHRGVTVFAGARIVFGPGGTTNDPALGTPLASGRNVTVSTTNGVAAIVATSGAFAPGDVGRPISGPGIPAGATIASWTDATHVTLSANATGTGSGNAVVGDPSMVGQIAIALYAQAEQSNSDGSGPRAIHWDSDVVVNSGPNPLLIIGPDGNVVTSVNIKANGVQNPAPGDPLGAHPYVEVNDLLNHDTGDVWMQSSGGTIDGGAVVGPHYWGTFSFRDDWKTVTILNESARDLIIDDIAVINASAAPKVQLNAPGGNANPTFAIVRQVDPSLVTITNDFGPAGPNLLINGTIENPIGETAITSQFGRISSSSSRSGVSSFDGTHHALVRTNIVHLVALTDIAAASPYLNVDLIQWAGHDEDITTSSGGSQYLDLLTRLRDPAIPTPTPVYDIPIDHLVAGDSIFVLLQATIYQVSSPPVPGIQVNSTGPSPTGTYVTSIIRTGRIATTRSGARRRTASPAPSRQAVAPSRAPTTSASSTQARSRRPATSPSTRSTPRPARRGSTSTATPTSTGRAISTATPTASSPTPRSRASSGTRVTCASARSSRSTTTSR